MSTLCMIEGIISNNNDNSNNNNNNFFFKLDIYIYIYFNKTHLINPYINRFTSWSICTH